MKKKIIYLSCLCLAVLITVSSLGTVRAEETESTKQLSLNDAVKIMQTTGTRAEIANLNKASDRAVAEGHSETLTALKNESSGATISSQKASSLSKEFAKTQIDKNYQAEMNQIEYDTVNVYYGVLLAQDNVRIALNNLRAQQQIADNTNAKFEVGMLAKKDVLSAESGVTTAKSEVKEAQAALQSAKMNFNYLLGYPVMQIVVLSDTLKQADYEAENLDTAIKNAIANRNEIQGAEYAYKVNQLLLENIAVRYPENAAIYMNQKVAILKAEKAFKDAPNQIEIDIRNKATEFENSKAALESAEAILGYAREGSRLTSLSYDAGLCTLEEIQQAQLGVYKAELAVSSATSRYNLAGYAFRYAQSVGVQRIIL